MLKETPTHYRDGIVRPDAAACEMETLPATALAVSADERAYFVNRQLRRLFPDRYLLECSDCSFDVDAFARDGQCEITLNPNVVNALLTEYVGLHRGLTCSARQAWMSVTWLGRKLQMLSLSWRASCFEMSSHRWLIADTAEDANAFFLAVCDWHAEVHGEVLVFDGGEWYKSEELYHSIKNANFDNLILPAALKNEIRSDLGLFLESRSAYERYRIPWKRGILLLGPPGNGKTHTVKALINQYELPCLYVKSFKERRKTDEEGVRDVFKRARETTPCILVLEDLDALIGDENRAFFLNELDGFAANTGIFVLATTNHPERLDPAILNRPSRFDRKYYFELPDAAMRHQYIETWQSTVEPELRLTPAGLERAAALTEGFSYAYLKELLLSSAMRWIGAQRADSRDSMDAILEGQCAVLREQMSSMEEVRPDGIVPPERDPY